MNALFDLLARRHADAPPMTELMEEEAPDLPLPPHDSVRPASVLVGFVAHDRPTLLLTRRQDHLRSHAGQVAFPGGRADEADADAVATALREAREEVGLPEDTPRIIGTMAPFRTFTGYAITPVLAVVPPGLSYRPDPGEVARVFEGPCDQLFDPAQRQLRAVEWQGRTRRYWESDVDGERVWGVTAALIRRIGAALGLDDDPTLLNMRTVSP